MAIHLDTNPYNGINAHYNSLLQNMQGGWLTFHSDHITHIKSALNLFLPANYYAVTEQSLQIQLAEGGTTRPDIAIFRRSEPGIATRASAEIVPTLELATDDVAPEEDDLTAAMIYKQPDIPVTRLELLSPSNKTSERNHYLAMRRKTLNQHLRLVELDYLHETPTPFRNALPDYTRHEAESYPYYIVISDPTPTSASSNGITRFYCFHVDDMIPKLTIPLLDGESITFDFGDVYKTTFEDDRRTRFLLDYAQVPVNIDSYSQYDRERIIQRMQLIAQQP